MFVFLFIYIIFLILSMEQFLFLCIHYGGFKRVRYLFIRFIGPNIFIIDLLKKMLLDKYIFLSQHKKNEFNNHT